MKPKYKNQLFKTLLDSFLGLESFSFEQIDPESGHNAYKITFLEKGTPSSYNFIVREYLQEYNQYDCKFIQYTPRMSYSECIPQNEWAEIKHICEVLNLWIDKHIKAYLDDKDEVDLWAEYLKLTSFQKTEELDLANKDDFTLDEKQQIKLAIQNLKLTIAQNFELNSDQLKLINNNLKYLAEGVDRLNKVDWKTILIGQFFTISTAIATSPQQFNELYHMFLKVIHIMYFLPQ